MNKKVKDNQNRLREELALDPQDIGYSKMSDKQIVAAMYEHEVVQRLGFFVTKAIPLVDQDGKDILNDDGTHVFIRKRVVDVVREDHIARFRKK